MTPSATKQRPAEAEAPPRSWTLVETCTRGKISAQVSRRDDVPNGPLFSIRVGTTRHRDEDVDLTVSAHMSVYDVEDARALLKEMADKYIAERASVRTARQRTR